MGAQVQSLRAAVQPGCPGSGHQMDAGPNRGFDLILEMTLQLQRGRRQLPPGPESCLLFVLRHSGATFGAVVTAGHSQGRCRRHKGKGASGGPGRPAGPPGGAGRTSPSFSGGTNTAG